MTIIGHRANLSSQVADRIRERIVDGRLMDGQRLNEVHLAAEFEVSRTPMREALGILGGDGFLEQQPRRGWFVRPMTLDEFEQLYAMRPILDPAALEAAGLPPAGVIDRLEALNVELEARVEDVGRRIDLDDAWHRLLLAHGSNRILLAEIDRFIRLTRRYEHAYLGSQNGIAVAVDEHRAIQDRLAAGDLSGAVDGLRQNMTSGAAPLRAWLKRRQRLSKPMRHAS